MIGKQDLLRLTRSVQEFDELLGHLAKNMEQLAELSNRLDESREKRDTVVKAVEEIHSMFASIKEKQQLILTLNRELGVVEHSVGDRVKIITDETRAILGKMVDAFNK